MAREGRSWVTSRPLRFGLPLLALLTGGLISLTAGASPASAATNVNDSSQPSVGVNPATDDQYVFWTDPVTSIDESFDTGSGWNRVNKGWNATTTPTTATSAGVDDSGQQFVFWMDSNGGISEAWYASGTWNTYYDISDSGGSSWACTGNCAPVSQPSVDVNGTTGDQSVFWKGSNGHIWNEWYTGGTWHGPSDHGWSTASAPSAGTDDSGQQFVFWQGSNGDVYEEWNSGGTWQTSPWDTGWSAASTPSVAVNATNGNQFVFFQSGTEGSTGAYNIYEQSYTSGSWQSSPANRGWSSAGPPAAGTDDSSNLWVYWESPSDGGITEGWDVGAGWQTPNDHGWPLAAAQYSYDSRAGNGAPPTDPNESNAPEMYVVEGIYPCAGTDYSIANVESQALSWIQASDPTIIEITPFNTGSCTLASYESEVSTIASYLESNAPTDSKNYWAGFMFDEEGGYQFTPANLEALNSHTSSLVNSEPGHVGYAEEDQPNAWVLATYNAILADSIPAPQNYESTFTAAINSECATYGKCANWLTVPDTGFTSEYENYIYNENTVNSPAQALYWNPYGWVNYWRSQ